jgi:hypothetical protein
MSHKRNQKRNLQCLETNENAIYKNVQTVTKTIIRKMLRAINTCVKKEKRPKIHNLTFYLKELKIGE